MTTFKDRQKAYESKFAFDEEMSFKAHARANKLLGQWAAEKLGLSGENASTYALEVVKSDLDEPGQEDVFRKVVKDLNGIVDENEIRSKAEELLHEAREQIQSEAS
ncbi:MAG: DUF1476 domain-containing protein [Rhodobacteraceae bacterium]|nr:DUF1476 domain-containing protein [Paracoccaceae bacterium]